MCCSRVTQSVFVFLLLLVAGGRTFAQPGGELGVGIILDEPTGITVHRWLDGDTSIDAAFAWSTSGRDTFHFHADYLLHRHDLVRIPELSGRFSAYYGVGGKIKFNDDDTKNSDDVIGVRIPIGINYLFAELPIDLFVEVVPLLVLSPDSDVQLKAALGARYYF